MTSFSGQMGIDLWSRELWQKSLSDNMVVVCTAEVLRGSLHHSFISMDQINLLIFDEAHHAKKDHPYARIIKDFYAQEEDKTKRPKIFGMTASPVDARVDVGKAAAELEALLHCQIATAADPSLMKYGAGSIQQQVLQYGLLSAPFETELYRQMKAKLGENVVFKRLLMYSKEASSDLGSWCADHVWQITLKAGELQRLESKTERKLAGQKVVDSLDVFEAQVSLLREAHDIVAAHNFQTPQLSSEHMSTKIQELVGYLRDTFERETEHKCIVFVKQRYTVQLLADLFRHKSIGTPHLRIGTLVGLDNPHTHFSSPSVLLQAILSHAWCLPG
jgi:endoribonuclease Dicer